MHVPGLPNLPAPSPDMVDNWRHTGSFTDNSWRWDTHYKPPKIELIKIEPIKPVLPEIKPLNLFPRDKY